MKKLSLILSILLAASLLLGQTEKPVFDPANLTVEEIQNCENFRNKKGQVRWNEFQKIINLFPESESSIDSSRKILSMDEETTNFVMTKKDLVKLIGEPDFDDGAYELGKKRFDCEVYFFFNENDEVLGLAYSNCTDDSYR